MRKKSNGARKPMLKSVHEEAHEADKLGFAFQAIDAVVLAAYGVIFLAMVARAKWASRSPQRADA